MIDWKTINRKSKELLKRFDLDIDVTARLDHYSVAVQQMIAIARAVDIQAKVLILDEPTSSLSTAEVEKLFSIMRMLKDRGLGIVFVTHFLDQSTPSPTASRSSATASISVPTRPRSCRRSSSSAR